MGMRSFEQSVAESVTAAKFAEHIAMSGMTFDQAVEVAVAHAVKFAQLAELARAAMLKPQDVPIDFDDLLDVYGTGMRSPSDDPTHKRLKLASENVLLSAIEILRGVLGEHSPELARNLCKLGSLYHGLGRGLDAEPHYRQATEISVSQLGDSHPEAAECLFHWAVNSFDLGQYAQSEQLLQRALLIRREKPGAGKRALLACLGQLAKLYCELGDHALAEPLYRQCLGIRGQMVGEEHPEYAETLNDLARVCLETGQSAMAETLLEQAIEIWTPALVRHPGHVTTMSLLVQVYRVRRLYHEAEAICQRTMRFEQMTLNQGHPGHISRLHSHATLLHDMGRWSEAEEGYLKAVREWREIPGESHPELGQSLHQLGLLYAATGRPLGALSAMQEAALIENRMIGQMFRIGSEKQRTGYIEKLQENQHAFLSLICCHRTLSSEYARAGMDFVVKRKAIGAAALVAQRDAVLGGKYLEVAPTLQALTMLQAQIAQKTLAGPRKGGVQAHQQLLAEWNAQKERLEAEVARQVPEMNLEQKLRSIDHQVVAMAVPVGATLVEFVRFDVFDFKAVPAKRDLQWKPERYLAFVMPGREPDRVETIDLGEAEPIDRMIATFRSIITGKEDEGERRGLGTLPSSVRRTEGEDVGLRLREAIFDPLLKAVGDRKRLMISPDGDLSRLPFEVLPTDDGRRLIDEYRISYLGAGRDVVRLGFKSNREPSRSLVAADPDFDLGAKTIRADVAAGAGRRSRDLKREAMETFERLPGTRQEGENIAAMLDAELWTGGAALDARLKQCHSPRILHLATHGFFLEDQPRNPNDERLPLGSMSVSESGMQRLADARFENPLLRSGLALAGVNTWLEKGELMEEAEDGLLTAEDVSGLDLLDTELVVLSACDTGLGEVRVGEGVFGLRRAFVLAGAKTLVMSLWKVPDEQTRELMEDFYRRILAGEPRADALRAAQLAMKAKYSEPFYWGAFICQGDPGRLAQFG